MATPWRFSGRAPRIGRAVRSGQSEELVGAVFCSGFNSIPEVEDPAENRRALATSTGCALAEAPAEWGAFVAGARQRVRLTTARQTWRKLPVPGNSSSAGAN